MVREMLAMHLLRQPVWLYGVEWIKSGDLVWCDRTVKRILVGGCGDKANRIMGVRPGSMDR